MRKSKQSSHDLYYFSRRLENKLNGMSRYPLTIVEAPSGFGKTTAVRVYLGDNLPHAARQYWYVCMGEPPVKAWDGICGLFDNVDTLTAQNLRKLGLPTPDTLTELMSILRGLDCREEIYLIIDNYQFMENDIPRKIMNAFSIHESGNLHIIFITQPLKNEPRGDTHYTNINLIGSDELVFDRASTAEYFRMAGIRLPGSELDSVWRSAEGWIAAIHLQLLNYQQTGTFERTSDVDQLVKIAVWNRLTDDEREYLLALSVLDGFTTKQARIMYGDETIPENIMALLDDNAFIRYLPEKDLYAMHSILQNYLRKRFYSVTPQDSRLLTLRRAGESCAAIHDYYPAMRFFYQANDFDAILSLPMQEQYINYQNERYIIEWVVRVVKECPTETLRHYPKSITTFAFEMFFFGQFETFGYLCEVIGSMLSNPGELSADAHRVLAGEMEFVKSFMVYNDIEKMSGHHKAAYALLNGPSGYMFVDSPWTFGAVSVLYMFWSKIGELAHEIKRLDECLPYYIKLSRGHGTGADIVMHAETLFAEGHDADAEAMCHKAIYVARGKDQTSLCLCAELILARIAILRGDVDMYNLAASNISKYAEGTPDWQNDRMVDLCTATLSLTLGETGISEWLTDMDGANKNIFTAALPYCHILYGRWLLATKQYSKLYGVSSILINEAEKMNYILPQVYHLIHLAAANREQGNIAESQGYLEHALSLALPDKVYIPLAEYGDAFLPLLETAKLSAFNREDIDNIMKLSKRQAAGIRIIKKSTVPKSLLTPREREVALLAKDGLTRKEIAEQLYITENTVKTMITSIYNKLDIHSRAQLGNKVF